MLAGISGARQAAQASRALAAQLRADPRFAAADNGTTPMLPRIARSYSSIAIC
jgi:hypothetical protein